MAKLKYDDTFPLRAEDYARKGMIDKDIAKSLGIAEATLYEYQKVYPKFSEALKRGKAPVDVEVENALLKRARGFDYEEIHTEYRLKAGETEVKDKARPSVVKRIKKTIVPDVTACIFWLKNRRRDRWRDDSGLSVFGTAEGDPIQIEYVLMKAKKQKKGGDGKGEGK